MAVSGMVQIQQFINDELIPLIEKKIPSLQKQVSEWREGIFEKLKILSDKIDYFNRKNSERDSKIHRLMRDINSVDKVQQYEINRLKEKVAALEEKVAQPKTEPKKSKNKGKK